MRKRCSRCKRRKPLVEFPVNRSKPDGRGHACLICQRRYNKSHYQKNKSAYIRKAAKLRKDLMVKIRDRKRGPCSDCGGAFPPWCMDFDHVRGVKMEAVSRIASTSGRVGIEAEIAKCDLVCANCHRSRTHRRKCAGCSDCKMA